jgi:SAM-dependent methyltransferase
MRQTAEKDLSRCDNFISVSGSDKNTGLALSSVDFVTAAQAFHWFDRQAFKLECRRILKPGGKAVLVYNNRDESSDITQKNDEITRKYSIDLIGYKQRGDSPEAYGDFFADGVCEYRTFRNDLQFTRESFIGRNLSSSHTPKEDTDPEKYHGYIEELNALLDEYNIAGILNFPQCAKSYVGGV